MVEVQISYFGMISELTEKKQEPFSCKNPTTSDLKKSLFRRYPSLENMQFAFAINKKLVQGEVTFNTGDEIALLPPFAGG